MQWRKDFKLLCCF